MIGARLTPHHTHTLAVLVRVLAALVFVGAAVLIPLTVAGVALHHVAVDAALTRIAAAGALTALTFVAARRFDPLRR